MLLRTHLAITSFFILLLLPFISHKIIFVLVALLATFIPDIDSENSKLGKKWIFKIIRFFTKHRGFFHSFTFLLLITVIFAMFLPIFALGFFVGYGSHLFADSFTPEGITPFYPWKRKSCGKLRTGGKLETGLFLGFLIVDLALIIRYVFGG